MILADAVRLIREKYLDEREERHGDAVAAKYQAALVKYPATMATAHLLFALDESSSRAPEFDPHSSRA